VYNVVITSRVNGYDVDPITPGKLELYKTVDGAPFAEWFFGEGYICLEVAHEFLSGISFKLYAADKFGAYDADAEPVAIGKLGFGGLITFTPEVEEAGWYVIVEELSGMAADTFQPVPPLFIYFNGRNVADGAIYSDIYLFNQPRTYVNGPINGHNEFNGFGDFHVNNARTGELISSFCAELDTGTYDGFVLVNKNDVRFANDAKLKSDIIKVLNYVYDTWGSLNEWPKVPHGTPGAWYGQFRYSSADGHPAPELATKAIAQIAIWALLDNGNVATISEQWGEDRIIAKAINDAVAETLANFATHEGTNIVDIVFLAQADYVFGMFTDSQPQIIPVFSAVFNNLTKGPSYVCECDCEFFCEKCKDKDCPFCETDGTECICECKCIFNATWTGNLAVQGGNNGRIVVTVNGRGFTINVNAQQAGIRTHNVDGFTIEIRVNDDNRVNRVVVTATNPGIPVIINSVVSLTPGTGNSQD
jgi:hypothetical protein